MMMAFCMPSSIYGQLLHPTNYFRSPLDIPLQLSGTFGELRPNHLHTGLDIQTKGQEGLPVYAVADGFVVRVKVSPHGYGKVIYINHKNGYTSVYGHLQKYVGKIADKTLEQQRLKESFEVEYFMPPGQMPIKKGEIIALSGNSGGSAGPHLHFEIRDERTEAPINPLYFGYKIADNVKPQVRTVAIYPYNHLSRVNATSRMNQIKVLGAYGDYHLGVKNQEVSGPFYLGISCLDQHNMGFNQNGVFSIQVKMNQKTIMSFKMDQFLYKEARYANALGDFKLRVTSGQNIYKLYKSPGNLLKVYDTIVNNGLINLAPRTEADFEISVKDFNQNESVVRFKISSTHQGNYEVGPADPYKKPSDVFYPLKNNSFKGESCKVDVPSGALYDTMMFYHEVSPQKPGSISDYHSFGEPTTPLQTYCDFAIKANHVSDDIKARTIAAIYEFGKRKGVQGGTWKGNYFHFSMRSFGEFQLIVDSIKPYVKPINFTTGKSLPQNGQLRLVIGDNLSGVKSFKSYIDDKWVLFDFDGKRSLIVHTLDKNLPVGEHVLKIIVVDEVGNQNKVEILFRTI